MVRKKASRDQYTATAARWCWSGALGVSAATFTSPLAGSLAWLLRLRAVARVLWRSFDTTVLNARRVRTRTPACMNAALVLTTLPLYAPDPAWPLPPHRVGGRLLA